MNLSQLFEQNASKRPEKMALYYENRSYTYAELNNEINKLAHGLANLGVKKGEKIALMMKNSDNFVISYYACIKMGFILVPMNFRLVEREITYIMDQSDSMMVICDTEFEDVVVKAAKNVSAIRQIIVTENPKTEESLLLQKVLSKNATNPLTEIESSDDIHILYTSGTTGNPKGALFDHQRALNVMLAITGTLGYNSEEKYIHIAPLFHAAQLVICLLSGLSLGGTHVIHRDFNPEVVFKDIEKHQITNFFAVPTIFSALLSYPDKDRYDVSSIKRFTYGAAPMSASLVQACMDFFKSPNFYSLCGLTEGGPSGIYLTPAEHITKIGSAGKDALWMTESKMVLPDGSEAKSGEVGELILKGFTIMKEYYKKPQETAETLRNGWLYTGDLGVKDDDGYVYILDRSKDMIITGGENVYSVEVENILGGHPQIADVAIVGTPDIVWGEIVTAVIVTKSNETIDLKELDIYCREHLAAFKIPRKAVFQDELPRNASGKLMKFQLREWVSSDTQNEIK
ncbi:long-chain fatty acid--CoA ligase [Sporosarcina sp. P34]|uniref:long-chain-fatty-acid--CoA ligase n=1 Tax=Sporosarcina sp. P34 TaxID=2048247 RepID=UPI000C173A2B|nr:long-chain-fatty-acid--CoA ligase [Sporosarcina sp. P34]PID13865.1 long-chain fatty acid--CoA ligase [Sporosarcina sp. P34]